MRKRLIGKAFAVAMTGAMAFTATPVTANIFNVAHVIKAAEADQAEEWTYCYVGLTWAEYWAHEDVYNAGNASSSDVLDSKKESDKGGYDVITRATAKHGLHRGSYQCMATIFTTDADGKTGPEYKVSHWSDDGKTIYLTDGSSVSWNKGKITDNGNTYTMSHYEVSGIKYVPVAVKTSQLNDLKAKYQVVENGGTLTGGYTEVNLSAYTATANVTANTNGLKTATENSDGSFSFSARKTGSESGLKDTAIKKVDSDKITVTVQPGAGSYGEFLRVDLNGDAYGDLGSNMQAVTWTYYGYDDTYSKPLATYGTKFAADNWMHKSMGIQLGLTESIRCQLPEDYDGTGYWKLTISALGYEDFSFNIQATGDNIANAKNATDKEKSDLQKLIDQANDMKADKDSYCDRQDKAWADLDTELGEAVDALKDEVIYSGTVKECTSHLTAAMKAVTKKNYETITTPASTSKDGSIVVKCSNCGDVKSTTTIAKIKSIALNKTSFTENGKVQKATVVAKDSANKTIAASNYTVSYSNSNSKKPGTYTATVKFNGKNYTGTKKLTYKINAKAPAKTTVKLSKAKKTSLKASWSKVANATSYEVQYGTSKSFKGAKTVKVSSKSSSTVLTKLKKNKKYYVRVRAVRTVKVDNKNTTLRASWSSAKNLKTKKK
ncbi:penicillin-binding Tp47 domain C-containing protein [Anaerostipes sp.]|uniref:penicillin-binding Tp47 domain C-containing protein n=1 Tax=Anaerostipes sp. TaxID=1872530 RepID=UPI002E75A5E0|nr:penicillin-binding Tp47 domain C-containing protein [Anaerostipes sp.]MED9815348.1 penicillin-binding Tp47 domain C-containing protein [Anaerostipes sp.]